MIIPFFRAAGYPFYVTRTHFDVKYLKLVRLACVRGRSFAVCIVTVGDQPKDIAGPRAMLPNRATLLWLV